MTRLLDNADRQDYRVYQLRGITYVPHYTEPGVYVCPGFGRHHQQTFERLELLRAGAKEASMSLFRRTRN